MILINSQFDRGHSKNKCCRTKKWVLLDIISLRTTYFTTSHVAWRGSRLKLYERKRRFSRSYSDCQNGSQMFYRKAMRHLFEDKHHRICLGRSSCHPRGNICFVDLSDGKSNSIRSSWVVKSRGVPSVVIVVKKLAFLAFFSRTRLITGKLLSIVKSIGA